MTGLQPVVVDVGPLRETHYTGIPNVIAEVCSRLLMEPGLALYFALDGHWIDTDSMRRCLAERSGLSLAGPAGRFAPAESIRARLAEGGALDRAVALYTNHRPPRKVYPREGMIVYDLSMILVPECHPATSVTMYTSDLEQQIACSDILFCISEATARDLAWVYGVPASRLRVALLGSSVDLAVPDQVRAAIGGRAVEPFLLMLGSIEPRKNAGLVLEWLSLHPEVLDAVRVVFAGRQAWGDSFGAMIEGKGLQGAVAAGRIVFMGFIDETVKAALLTGAAGLLYPSIFEGFGLPLVEAMAIGTPVLNSVSTSMPEVVGDCGYGFDPYSVASLHAAYSRLMGDRASGAVDGVVARAKARAAGFSYEATYRVIRDGLLGGG